MTMDSFNEARKEYDFQHEDPEFQERLGDIVNVDPSIMYYDPDSLTVLEGSVVRRLMAAYKAHLNRKERHEKDN